MIRGQEVDHHSEDRSGQARPEAVPGHCARLLASTEPPTSAEVTQEVADTTVHKRQQGLTSRSPSGVDALIQIDLRRDKDRDE